MLVLYMYKYFFSFEHSEFTKNRRTCVYASTDYMFPVLVNSYKGTHTVGVYVIVNENANHEGQAMITTSQLLKFWLHTEETS